MTKSMRVKVAAVLAAGSMVGAGVMLVGVVPTASAEQAPGSANVVVKGQTITEDTTWTAEGGPYEITGPIVVPEGVTLTLGPGAEVSASGRGFSTDAIFGVDGTLRAAGTESAPVLMRFNEVPNAVAAGRSPGQRTGVVDLDRVEMSTPAIDGSYTAGAEPEPGVAQP